MSRKQIFGIAVALLLSGASASSYNLSPWILIFEPEKKIISQTVTFNFQSTQPNTGRKPSGPVQGPLPDSLQNDPVPVEISISAREVTHEGNVIYPSSAGADDFVVYPSQFILYPGDSKKVQVQWVGAKVPDKEISFGFIATQLPLKFKEPKEQPKTAIAQIMLQTRYEGIIVVRPKSVAPNVVVDSAYARNDSAGTSLVLLLDNRGTGMQNLKNIAMTVSPLDKDGKIRFNESVQIKDIKPTGATGQSLLAGFKRKLSVPWPPGFPVVPVKVLVTFPEVQR
jgi:hypothetical protein